MFWYIAFSYFVMFTYLGYIIAKEKKLKTLPSKSKLSFTFTMACLSPISLPLLLIFNGLLFLGGLCFTIINKFKKESK